MTAADIETTVQDIDSTEQDAAADPCGENLEYDPAFLEMEATARGVPERQEGDTVVPAEPPDWRLLRDQARELLSRTEDIRVVGQLARARTRLEGFPGLHECLALLRGMLESHWDDVHPQLDSADGDDATMRINAIRALCDPETTLCDVREAVLVDSRAVGVFTLRDAQHATGRVASRDGGGAGQSVIDAAFMDSDLDDLRRRAGAVAGSLDSLAAIEALLIERVGSTRAPDLDPLKALLSDASAMLSEALARRGISDTTAEPSGDDSSGEATAPAPPTALEDIGSREDVVRVLDRVCAYYERHEPSSPVPLLLQRAKRLVGVDFMQLLRDLAPDGVAQTEVVIGLENTETAEEV